MRTRLSDPLSSDLFTPKSPKHRPRSQKAILCPAIQGYLFGAQREKVQLRLSHRPCPT